MAKQAEIKTILSAEDKTQTSLKSVSQSFEKFSKTASATSKKLTGVFQKIKKAMTPVKEEAGQTSATMSAFKANILATGATALAKKLQASVIQYSVLSDELAKNSKAVSINMDSFQGLNYAAQLSGVSTQSLYTHLKRFSGELGKVRAGQAGFGSGLKKTNPQLLEQLKLAKSNEEAFLIASDAIKNAKDETEKAYLSQEIFGRGGVELNKLMGEGSEKIKAMMKEKIAHGVITEKDAKKSEDLQDALTRVNSAFQGVGNTLMSTLIPVCLKLLNLFNSFIVNNQAFISGLTKAIGIILPYATGILLIVMAYLSYKKAVVATNIVMGIARKGMLITKLVIHGMTIATHAMNAAFLANPVGAIILAIIAVIVVVTIVVVVLYKKFEAVRNVINAIGRALKNFFMPIIKTITSAFEVVLNTVKKIFSIMGKKKKTETELEAPETVKTPLQAQQQEEKLEQMHAVNRTSTKIDVNFNNLPPGVSVVQSQPVPGINLSLGYSGG